MPPEPATKRAVAFVDGQNLFFAARQAFGYTYPNYDFPALAAAVCASNGWQLEQARFLVCGTADRSNTMARSQLSKTGSIHAACETTTFRRATSRTARQHVQ